MLFAGFFVCCFGCLLANPSLQKLHLKVKLGLQHHSKGEPETKFTLLNVSIVVNIARITYGNDLKTKYFCLNTGW